MKPWKNAIKERTSVKLFLYLVLFYILPFILLYIALQINNFDVYHFLFYFVFISLVSFLLARYAYIKYILPMQKINREIKKVAEGKKMDIILPSDIKFGEFSGFVNNLNKIVLELEAYRAFELNKVVEEKNKAETLVDIIPDGALLIDDKNEVLYFNFNARSILELNLNKKPLIIPEAIVNKNFNSKIKEIIEQNKNYDIAEVEIENEKKMKLVYTVISKKFHMPTLKKEGRVFIIRDITKEKEFESAKDDFFHMITHDMRSPLTSIEGYCEMIEKTINPDKEIKNYFDQVFYSSKRLKNMIDDILNFKKLREKKMILELAEIDPQILIDKVIDENRIVAKSRGINLYSSKNLGKNCFYGDLKLMERIITNLVNNSLKFTPSGGEIEISYKEEGEEIIFIVSDTGIGISEDKKTLIFEKYTTFGHKETGFGLGLAFVRLAVEAHGGKIWFESKVNEGTKFFISINKNLKRS